MSHPNLSEDINMALAQSERDGGVFVKDIPVGLELLVQTRNTLYTLKRDSSDEKLFLIKGHARFCPDFTPCRIHGSTWGGSMLKMDFIGINMLLEFSLVTPADDPMFRGVITTSIIKELR